MDILFLCSANYQRSNTAEEHFSSRFSQHTITSAGLNPKEVKKRGTTLATRDMVTRADLIFVMEPHHKEILHKHISLDTIYILNIPDIYTYYADELCMILDSKLADILQHDTIYDMKQAGLDRFKSA